MSVCINNNDLAGKVERVLGEGHAAEALDILNRHIESTPEDDEAYYLRGRVNWKLGRNADAISDYCKAVDLNPSSCAAHALDMARNIMDFYNKDLYNP